MQSRGQQGFTLIEMLIVLAVIAVLLSIGILNLRSPELRLYTNELKALIQEARYLAINANTPVAVKWDAPSQSFVTIYKDGALSITETCDASVATYTVDRADMSNYKRVSATAFLSGDLVWLPSGLGRKCDGTALAANGAITISDDGKTRDVTVNPFGRIGFD